MESGGQNHCQEPAAFSTPLPVQGRYEVVLKVTDPSGAFSRDKAEIFVGNEPPQEAWQLGGNQSFYFGKTEIPYSVQVTHREDGSTENGQIDPRRLRINIDYLKEGKDVAQVILGHQTAGMSAGRMKYASGQLAIGKSDCATCHAEDHKVNGPSYIDIANRYFGDASAIKKLAEKVIRGGGGVWGESTMAAHPNISQQEAEGIVQYILSLAGEVQAEDALPLSTPLSLMRIWEGKKKRCLIFFRRRTPMPGRTGCLRFRLRLRRCFATQNWKLKILVRQTKASVVKRIPALAILCSPGWRMVVIFLLKKLT
ncbi:MAG: hypothetical protein R2788_16435 [Saprospiraceae bacterium]